MRRSLYLAAALIGAFSFTHGQTQAQEIVLRLHQFLPATESVPRDGLVPWANAIEEASGGRIRVDHYPSMQIGGAPANLFDQARDGVVDLVWTVLGYTPGRFPRSETFELPFMVASAEATSRAFQRFVEENAMDEFAAVKLIAVHTHGAGLFHTRTPVESLEDLQNLTIRGGSRVISTMLDDLGAEPVGMPIPQVPEALTLGHIRGATMPWQVTISLRSSEIVSHHTEFSGDRGLFTQTFAFVMNRARYDGLPDDLRQIIDDHSGIEWAALFGRINDVDDALARQMAVDRGNTIVTLDAVETARWRDAAQITINNWLAEAQASGIDGPALYARALELVAEEVASSAQ